MAYADTIRTSNADLEDVADLLDDTHTDVTNLDTGWSLVDESWAYASASTITVPTDATTRFQVGDKIRLTNSTTKYYYITGVAATVLTVSGGIDYVVANTTISSVYISRGERPFGFPKEFNYTPTISKVSGSGTMASSTVTRWTFSMDCNRVHVKLYFKFDIDTNTITAVRSTLPVAGIAAGYEQYSMGVFAQEAGAAGEVVCWATVGTASTNVDFYKLTQTTFAVNANNTFIFGEFSYLY